MRLSVVRKGEDEREKMREEGRSRKNTPGGAR
jgi:hypothetical protein